MKLSSKEKSIIDYLQKEKVSTKKNIYQIIDVSSRTVDRALSKYGYYTSYNFNASYYTLIDIPNFDDYGLWNFNTIRFSINKTLTQTIISLISDSESGYTNIELSRLLGIETKIILSRLCTQNKISKFNIGHQAIYVSIAPSQNTIQQACRTHHGLSQFDRVPEVGQAKELLPQRIDVRTVIAVLTSMIQYPQSDIKSLLEVLKARNLKVKSADIETIIFFYDLEKKRGR